MKNLLLVLLALGVSSSAFAKKAPVDPKEMKCRTVVLTAALAALQKETGWTDEEMDDLVSADEDNVEVFYNKSAKMDNANVRLNSANIQDWDGYADYNMNLRETKQSCKVVGKPQLTGSEGI